MSLVTQEHIDQYKQEGCVRVEGVFGEEWTDRLIAALDGAYGKFGTPEFDELQTSARHQNAPTVHPGEGQVQLRNFAQHIPEIRDWLYNSIAGELVGALMEAEHVRYWMDASFLKEGDSPSSATPWHNDECTFPFQGQMMPSFWVALTDVDEDNAPMVTLAGSNLDEHRYHSPMSRQDIELDGFKPWDDLVARVEDPDADVRVWPCKKGDILLIHPRTIHSSLPRRAKQEGRRVAFTTRWLGDDVYWDANELSIVLPISEEMSQGDPPPDTHFPIIWSRQNASAQAV